MMSFCFLAPAGDVPPSGSIIAGIKCGSTCAQKPGVPSLALALALTFASKVWAHVDASLWTGSKNLVPHADNPTVDGARDAIQHLHVELWKHERGVAACVTDVPL